MTEKSQVSLVDDYVSEYQGIQAQMSDPEVVGDQDLFRKLSKRYAQLQPIINVNNELNQAREDHEAAPALPLGDGIALRDVSARWPGSAQDSLRGVDLDVRPGEVLAIVGESGSGKTVTARSILGLLPATATTRGAAASTCRSTS